MTSNRKHMTGIECTIYFCKRVISVPTLLIIIHITMYFLISLSRRILETKQSWPYLAIQPSNVVLVGRPIVNFSLLLIFLAVQNFYRNDVGFCWIVYLIFFSPIMPFLPVGIRNIGIYNRIIWESKRRLKPLKPPFSLGKLVWYHFHGLFFVEFSFHLGEIMRTERVKQR